jgi:hypothetical protein
MSKNSEQYTESLRKVLSDRDLRILIWRLIVEDCKVFQEEFPLNASAYTLLAKQEIGKRLLADLKSVNRDLVLTAEKDYEGLMAECLKEAEGEEYGSY